jgi:hypothetical protein
MKNQPATQTYEIINNGEEFSGLKMAEFTVPRDPSNAIYGGICFYDKETDTFLDSAVWKHFLVRKKVA